MSTDTYNPGEDYYAVLGLDEDFTPEQLKKTYRKLARELHPDANPDPAAVEPFKLVGLAYETLGDVDKRAEYDELRLNHYLTQPPILRLSASTLNYGFVRTDKPDQRKYVVVHNDGGAGNDDLELVLSAYAGDFWTATVEGPTSDDPETAIARVCFIVSATAAIEPGNQKEWVTFSLVSGDAVSSARLRLAAQIERIKPTRAPDITAPDAGSARPTPPSGAGPSTAGPRSTSATAGSTTTPPPPGAWGPTVAPVPTSPRYPVATGISGDTIIAGWFWSGFGLAILAIIAGHFYELKVQNLAMQIIVPAIVLADALFCLGLYIVKGKRPRGPGAPKLDLGELLRSIGGTLAMGLLKLLAAVVLSALYAAIPFGLMGIVISVAGSHANALGSLLEAGCGIVSLCLLASDLIVVPGIFVAIFGDD